jgi:hypothetical protein
MFSALCNIGLGPILLLKQKLNFQQKLETPKRGNIFAELKTVSTRVNLIKAILRQLGMIFYFLSDFFKRELSSGTFSL